MLHDLQTLFADPVIVTITAVALALLATIVLAPTQPRQARYRVAPRSKR